MALPLVFVSSSELAVYNAVSVYNFLSRMIVVNEFCSNSEIGVCMYIYIHRVTSRGCNILIKSKTTYIDTLDRWIDRLIDLFDRLDYLG